MSERDQRRLRILPTAARLARTFHPALTDHDGQELLVIPALPDDTVAYVLDRLEQSGDAGVVVEVGDGAPRIVTLRRPNLRKLPTDPPRNWT